MESDMSQAPPSTPTTSINNSEETIINRKREYREIPSSFSSNLGRPRTSPPKSGAETKTTASGNNVKSVKAIVAWLESSNDKSSSLKSSDGDSLRTTLSPSMSTQTTASQPAAPVAQQTPGVEEYSLTLLKYKQYFTGKPLARCLDTSARSGENINTEPNNEEPKMDGTFLIEDDIAPKDAKYTHLPISSAGALESPQSHLKDQLDIIRPVRRDPKDVATFWREVRNYLSIPDEELYNVSSSTSHQRVLSIEEKMSEIDEFLNEEDDEAPEAAVQPETPSPRQAVSFTQTIGVPYAAQRCCSCQKIKAPGTFI